MLQGSCCLNITLGLNNAKVNILLQEPHNILQTTDIHTEQVTCSLWHLYGSCFCINFPKHYNTYCRSNHFQDHSSTQFF